MAMGACFEERQMMTLSLAIAMTEERAAQLAELAAKRGCTPEVLASEAIGFYLCLPARVRDEIAGPVGREQELAKSFAPHLGRHVELAMIDLLVEQGELVSEIPADLRWNSDGTPPVRP